MRDFKGKLSVGQEVIIALTNDSLRYLKRTETVGIHNIDKWTKKGIITKIGRKFITVNMNGIERKYNSEENYSEDCKYGSPDSKLYLSLNDIIEENNYNDMCKDINKYFNGYIFNYYEKLNLTLEEVEQIYNIINK